MEFVQNAGEFGNAFGADVCYGEAMAVGFLFVLKKVCQKFEDDEKKVVPISEENFFRLLHEINAILTGNDENENHKFCKIIFWRMVQN